MGKLISLPEAFKEAMRDLIKNEYDEFISSYEDTRVYGLRANLLKAKLDDFSSKMPFELEPIRWAEEGFYYEEEAHPGKHPYHESGAYYIQEPSAMSAVALLDPEPGDKILDLCAAPGGKSSQIAGRLNGRGLLVSNEIMLERAKILSQNIERMGVRNCVVTNENAHKLEGRFLGFFDKILVDAPCSGEGMFRKDENAIAEWTPENVIMCAKRQSEILDCAANMLRAGGALVYSTCTFAKEENEDSINNFLERHPDFKLETMERLWPHKVKGEGHFVARLCKMNDGPTSVFRAERYESSLLNTDLGKKKGKPGRDSKGGKGNSGISIDEKSLKQFLLTEVGIKQDVVDEMFEAAFVSIFGDNIYLTPKSFGSLSGLCIVRPGLHIAVNKGNRLEPAHALAMTLRNYELTKMIDLDVDAATKYLRGEIVNCEEEMKGWCVVFTDGFSTGFGKASQGVMKNHYPKGLRINW